MEQETLDKLYEDFAVEIKPGKGAFKYVRTRHILDRMNKAFKGNWGTHIVSHSIIDDEVLVLASVYIYNDEGHILAQQQGFGSAKKFGGVELGNIYKSATSKAIKSAVRNWGVALFLEEGDTGSDYSSNQATKATPIPSAMPQAPKSSTGTPAMPSMPSTSASVGTPSSMPSNSGMPSMPSVGAAMPMPQTGTVTANVATTFPGTPIASPKVDEASTFTELPTMTATPGKMPTAGTDAQTSITSVQKVAISSRIAAKGSTFEDISKDFYANRPNSTPVNDLADMTYTDALDLVSFLNSK
ncbi:hypothetical protein JZU46_06110 [bacterium]|nr:hypothetical protein [bacterium]